MSKSYCRRRYYKRRKNNSSSGATGTLLILALIAYVHGITYPRTLEVAVITGLSVLSLILITKLWRWRRHKVARPIVNEINAMTGLQFERHVADLLRQRGFADVRLTERYDLGVDIIAHKDGITWGIQVKRSSGMVKAAAVRQVVTALRHYHCDRAMVITNGVYSRPAITLAKSNDCVLVSGIKH